MVSGLLRLWTPHGSPLVGSSKRPTEIAVSFSPNISVGCRWLLVAAHATMTADWPCRPQSVRGQPFARSGLRLPLLPLRTCRSSAGILEELPGAAPVDSGPVSLPAAAHTLHGVR